MCLPGRSSDFDAHANLQSCRLIHNIITIYWQAGECKRFIDEGGIHTHGSRSGGKAALRRLLRPACSTHTSSAPSKFRYYSLLLGTGEKAYNNGLVNSRIIR